MRSFIYAIMTDRTTSVVAIPVRAILLVLSFFYGAAIRIRHLLYICRIFRRKRVPMKVVSVGNLTLGGTGKTPFVIKLSRLIEQKLHRSVCVAIRGYGWDEQAMLKKSMTEIPIMVGQDRAQSCHKAATLYGSGTAVLDDGFQHWELARDLDIVLVDAKTPFGNGHLFPRGILRESKAALKRADIIVLTKADRAGADLAGVKKTIEAINPDALLIEARHRPRCLYDRHGREEKLSLLSGKRVILVSGIGDPGHFAETTAKIGLLALDHIIFNDHHDYAAADAARVARRAAELKPEAIVTTEKDVVKLQRLALSFGPTPVYVLAIDMEITGEEALIDRLRRVYTR